MKKVLRLTDANFDCEVSNSTIPVLIDFWASWCPPCKMVEPVLEELACEYDGRIKVLKLNVDQNPKIASKYRIHGVPSFVLLNSDKILQQRTGAQSKNQLKEMIMQILQK